MTSPLALDPPLTDDSVVLRASEPRDLPAIDAGIHDPDVIRWIGQPHGSAIDVLALNRQRWANGSPTLAICERDGECVGLVWVNVRGADHTIGLVGYWLLPSARGRGLATRAVRLVAGWAVRDLGLTNLRLTTEPENERSRRVAERSGFRQTGVLRQHATIDGRLIDQVVYELRSEGSRVSSRIDHRADAARSCSCSKAGTISAAAKSRKPR
jgi:ribosomal-protein-alanine N-acetyltransferase